MNPQSAPGADADDDEAMESEAERHKEENWPRQADKRQPMKPLMDPEIVKEFLMGEYCLYGGTGWWKYEFCYGKKVDQYHEERMQSAAGRAKTRTVINLGRFDEEAHLQWLKANPAKRPKPVKDRKHVSHFYSGGDVCDITSRFFAVISYLIYLYPL